MTGWAHAVGFDVAVEQVDREWQGSPAQEIDAIGRRAWPAMRELDEQALEAATRPALEALAAMPAGERSAVTPWPTSSCSPGPDPGDGRVTRADVPA